MRTAKKSMLTSIVSLVLCIAMLAGTTFAWFTDEAVSKGNIIVSGEIDVAMYYSSTLENANWLTAEKTPVFTHENWEPGYTDVKYIKVVNEGNLSFQWKLGLDAGGSVSEISDVIDVYYVGAPSASLQSLDGLTSAGVLTSVLENDTVIDGTLLPGEEAIIAVAFHMQETAGNKYQKMSLCEEGFYVNLLATQFSAESDYFGSDYDNAATFPEGTVSENGSINIPEGATNNGILNTSLLIKDSSTNANVVVPAGVKLEDGATALKLNAYEVDDPNHNLVFDDGEEVKTFEVCVEGIAEDNTVPVIVNLGNTLGEVLYASLLNSYHIENGVAVPMTYVSSTEYFTEHNQFTYDPVTGETILYIATFSEFVVAESEIVKYTGKSVSSLKGTGTEKDPYLISTPEDLIYFASQVNGGNDYSGKFVKLNANISFFDYKQSFSPIGNQVNGKAFRGTFDGNGKVIMGLYQNGWDLGLEYGDKDGLGLFAYIEDATIKNLQLDHFEIIMEAVIMGNLVGYAYGNCTFENIAVTNSHISNYNWYTGGIAGWCGGEHTFTNVSVDHTNTVSGLWGSWDVPCGGLVGGVGSTTKVDFTNCLVAANIDTYNDVCANYQWYAYRYCGMVIGVTNATMKDPSTGTTYATISKDAENNDNITFTNCHVYYGKDVNRYYCELVANSIASYTHDYQFSRLTQVAAVNGTTITHLDGTKTTVPATGRYNYVVVNGSHSTENATCYHFVDGKAWDHKTAGTETVDGKEVLVENNQHIYIPFNQLFGGGQGVYGQREYAGITTHLPEEQTKTIYFQNNKNWSDVKIYYWYSNGVSGTGEYTWTNSAFPGESMTKVGNDGTYDVYSFELPVYASGFVINNGKSATDSGKLQTVDIKGSQIIDGNMYVLGKVTADTTKYDVYSIKYTTERKTVKFTNQWNWTDISVYYWYSDGTNEWHDVAFPGINATNVSGKVYSFNIPANACGYVIYAKYQGQELQTSDQKVESITNTKSFLVTDFNIKNTTNSNTITIFYQNSWNWRPGTLRIHYWGLSTGNTNWDTRPYLTKVGNDGSYDIYAYEIPKAVTGIVISGNHDINGNTVQTVDITKSIGISDGLAYCPNGESNGKAKIKTYSPTP